MVGDLKIGLDLGGESDPDVDDLDFARMRRAGR